MTDSTTLVVRDDVFLRHDAGPGHPERAARLRAVHDDLDAHPIPRTRRAEPRAATRADLERVHDPRHVSRIAATAGRERAQLDPDTSTSAESYEIARLAAGAVSQAAEAVVRGAASGAFALVRPPGHHAEAGAAMGFCLFNNVAVAAAHAIDALGCRRVAIVDPDVHHGNGTQHVFESRRDVLYVSSHRYPFYPGTGWFDEIGTGDGAGFTVNLPLPAGLGNADFAFLYDSVVTPIVSEFRPELVLVSAGFDTWKHDPLGGGMRLDEDGFAALFAIFRSWSDAHCPGRLVAALEGGYDPAGVVAGVRAGLEVMTGTRAPLPPAGEPSAAVREVARRARATLAPYWKSLS
jgi:acetoin utilization deacetylase AcuC-like enzyme